MSLEYIPGPIVEFYKVAFTIADHAGIWFLALVVPLLALKEFFKYRRDVKERRQENQVTFSFNIYVKNKLGHALRFRTALDRKLTELMPDDERLLKKMRRAAKAVPVGKSFFMLEEREEHADMMNSLLNSFSELTAPNMLSAFLSQQLGLVTPKVRVVVGVTSETYPGSRKVQKTRVMVRSLDELIEIGVPEVDPESFEKPHHSDRQTTMTDMYDCWRKGELFEWEIYLQPDWTVYFDKVIEKLETLEQKVDQILQRLPVPQG